MILAFIFYRDTVNKVLEGVKNLEPLKILVCCSFVVIYYLCEGTILYKMGRVINPAYRWYNGLSTSYKCEFVRVLTMGTGAGVAEVVFLQKDGVPAGNGTALSLNQYSLKRIIMMLIALAGFIFLSIKTETRDVMAENRILILTALIVSVIVSFFGAGLSFSKKLNILMISLLNKLSEKFPKRAGLFEKWKTTVNQMNETGFLYIHHPGLVSEILGLNLIKMLAIYIIPAFILMESVGFIPGTLLMAVTFVSATVIPAPSGVGALEFAFVMFFSSFMNQTEAITGVLVYRFATWIVPCVVGMVFFIIDYFSGRLNE